MLIIHTAARHGDTVTVRTLLSTAGALSLINTQDASGATPLYCAAHNGHASVMKQLIEGRCNINLHEDHGATPLYIAAQNGHASVTEQLIEARYNIVARETENGTTPLCIAAHNGHVTF
jgi:cytohesin